MPMGRTAVRPYPVCRLPGGIEVAGEAGGKAKRDGGGGERCNTRTWVARGCW
jgi:hypothetical protein